MIHFKLVSVKSLRFGLDQWFSLFCKRMSLVSAPFVEKDILSPLKYLWSFVKNWLYLCGFRLPFYYKFGCCLGGILIAIFVASRFLYSSSFHQQPKIIVWSTDIVQWITGNHCCWSLHSSLYILVRCTSSFPARL